MHSKMHTNAWDVSIQSNNSQRQVNHSTSDFPAITAMGIRIDADSSVSEKVLLDTVAERKIMDGGDVSISKIYRIDLYRIN